MRGFCSKIANFLIPIIVIAGLVVSFWAILCIELNVIPRIPINLRQETINGLDRVFLALSYSYLAGFILYFLTSRLPYLQKKGNVQPIIDAKIKVIGITLLNMNFEFREGGMNPKLDEVEQIISLFNSRSWTKLSKAHPGVLNRDAFLMDYQSVCKAITELIGEYHEFLNTEQLFLLENIREQSVDQFIEISKSIKKDDIEDFLNSMVVPLYREILESYNKLISLSNINLND